MKFITYGYVQSFRALLDASIVDMALDQASKKYLEFKVILAT